MIRTYHKDDISAGDGPREEILFAAEDLDRKISTRDIDESFACHHALRTGQQFSVRDKYTDIIRRKEAKEVDDLVSESRSLLN